MGQQGALRKALNEQVSQELAIQNACATSLTARGIAGRALGGCKAAKATLTAFYLAHPELMRPTDAASCVALTLPPDCARP